MKCPKCGFNSFEYYDSCKKCAADLIGYKQTHSIAAIVLPQDAKEKLAAEYNMQSATDDQANESVETHDDIFSFDLPGDSDTNAATDDPFNFDEPSLDATPAIGAKADDDIFADLLESTSQADESPFAKASPAPVAAKPVAASTPGEFDLESFSWDETPADSGATGSAAAPDDFDSLFGDMKESDSK